MECPNREELSAWYDKESDVDYSSHVQQCAECLTWLDDMREMEKALHSGLVSHVPENLDVQSLMEESRESAERQEGFSVVSGQLFIRVAAVFIVLGVGYLWLNEEVEVVDEVAERVEAPKVKVLTISSEESSEASFSGVESINDSDLSNVAVLGDVEAVNDDLVLASQISHVWAPQNLKSQKQALSALMAILNEMGLADSVQVREVENGVMELETKLMDSDLLELVKRLHEAEMPLMSRQQPQPESVDDILIKNELIRYRIQLTK